MSSALLENHQRQPTTSPKVGEKRPTLPALAVAHHFLSVSKVDSLCLYGSVGEDGAQNGPPLPELEPFQDPAMTTTGIVSSLRGREKEEPLPAVEVMMNSPD
jgi:hypothetical protein